MNDQYDATVLGIGSSHGDDSIGWHVVNRLSRKNLPGLCLRKLNSPMEIIDHLASSRQIHIVNAAIGMDANQPVGKFRYSPESQWAAIESASTSSTHGIDVPQTMRLAQTLDRPTDHVLIWFARGEKFDSMAEPSLTAIESARQCAEAIMGELRILHRNAR